jgi:hypothetical protein
MNFKEYEELYLLGYKADVVRYKLTDVSEEYFTSLFMVEE